MFNSKKTLRLGQWKGRRRSSRLDERVLRRLRRPSVLVRVGVAGMATLAVTMLAVWSGPPFPYRVGAVYSHDVRARVNFDIVNHVELVHEGPVEEEETAHFVDRPVV